MAMKIVISFEAMKKMLYAVKYTNFIDFYDFKQNFCCAVNILKKRSKM
jgi:hypothetical protein